MGQGSKVWESRGGVLGVCGRSLGGVGCGSRCGMGRGLGVVLGDSRGSGLGV